MAIDAVIFDFDGTLVDANGLHTRAWQQALEAYDYRVGSDRIAVEIGKGGTMLVPSLLGAEADAAHGQALRDLHDERFLALVDAEGVKTFPGVHELFAALRERGLKTAIATAAKQQSLERVMASAGLDLFDLADVVVTDSDVENSKPHPDVVEAAVKKLGLAPGQCVMVGDTPYDVESARRAGVTCLGVRTGVHGDDALYEVGARLVLGDVAELRDRLDEALSAASPGTWRLTYDLMQTLMEAALEEARAALENGNVPVGSVLAHSSGEVLARAHSQTVRSGDFLRHGEMVVFQEASKAVARYRHELILVSTLEPCVMCFGAAMEARVDTILYALDAPSNGGVSRCAPMRSPGMIMPRIIGGYGAAESRRLFEIWYERNPDIAFARDLLARQPE